ncbi:MAG: hypothetical protein V4495_26715 [Pseudomonadota bacterium]
MMWQFLKPEQGFQRYLLLLVCSLSFACSSEKSGNGEGAAYKVDLINAIRQSSKIIVTEHSSELDFIQAGQAATPKEKVYRTVTLTTRDRENFIAAIEHVSDKTQQAFSACVFDPHHTVYFYAQGKLSSKLDICFACSQQQWDATKHTPPADIHEGLAQFIKSVKLDTEREWANLVRNNI